MTTKINDTKRGLLGTLLFALPFLCAAQSGTQVQMQRPLPSGSGKIVVYTQVTQDGKSIGGLGSGNFKVLVGGKELSGVSAEGTFVRSANNFGLVFVVDVAGFKGATDDHWRSLVDTAQSLLHDKRVDQAALLTTSGEERSFATSLGASKYFTDLTPGKSSTSVSELIKKASTYDKDMSPSLHPVVVALIAEPSSGTPPPASDITRPVFVIDFSAGQDIGLKGLAEASGGAYLAGSNLKGDKAIDDFLHYSCIKSVAQMYSVSFPLPQGAKDSPPFTLQVVRDGKPLGQASYKGKPIDLIYVIAAGVVTLILLAALFVTVRRVMASKAQEYNPYDAYSTPDADMDAVTHGMERPVFGGMVGGGANSTSGTVSGTFAGYKAGSSSVGNGGDTTQGEYAPAGNVGDVTEGEGVAPMGAWVEVLSGPSAGKRMDVKTALAIGREATGSGQGLILVGDPKVSRRHAEIRADYGAAGKAQFRLVHLSQTNQSYVNERPARDEILRNGDELRVGATRLKFHEGDSAGSSTSSISPGDVTSGDVTL